MEQVQDYIYQFEGQQEVILQYLHELMMSYPEVISKIRYKIPFYYRKSWICYLNPGKKGEVELVFLRANELSNEQGLLDARGRKQVAGMTFYQLSDIPQTGLREIIEEALLLDDLVPYASKRKKGP